jgi:hypothetical protein
VEGDHSRLIAWSGKSDVQLFLDKERTTGSPRIFPGSWKTNSS